MEFDVNELNGFDIAVISVVFISTLFAFFRGFIKVIFSLVTWIGSGVATAFAYPHVYEYLSDKIDNDKALIAVSTVGVFTLIFIVVAYVNSKFVFLLRNVRGGAIDRTLGFTFGFIRGALIVCLLFFSINMTSSMLQVGNPDKPGPRWFVEAKTYNMLQMTTLSMLALLPEDTPGKFADYVDKIKGISTEAMGIKEPARALNREELEIMGKVMGVVPREDLQAIYNKYDGNTKNLSNSEKIAIFSEILKVYNNAVDLGKIKRSLRVPEDEISRLDNAIHGSGLEILQEQTQDETGYKKMNIKQLDRLIGNVE